MDLYSKHANRELGTLFSQLGLTEEFTRAEGTRLFTAEGTEFLDMTASYGALPFGHNPAFLADALRGFVDQKRPSLIKGNPNAFEARAAEALKAPFGARNVIFTNGGAETVNLAIKSARLVTGRRKVLSFWNSYHGTTGEALEATGNRQFREVFPTSFGDDVILVPFNDRGAMDEAFRTHRGLFACAIVEPVQGEGGVVPAAPGFLASLAELCSADGALLVLDEIQTGMGRTGRLSRALAEGVEPDILLLSKGLAGGYVPVGAVLYRTVWDAALGLHHNSTFGGNGLGMALVPHVLARLDPPFLEAVRARGARLLAGLSSLAREFPDLVVEARGDGLLTGLEFAGEVSTPSRFLGELVRQFGLLPAAVAYVRNTHRTCLATTLNTHHTLRVTPPLVATDAEIDRVIAALTDFCRTFRRGQAREVVVHLITKTVEVDIAALRQRQLEERRGPRAGGDMTPEITQGAQPAPAGSTANPAPGHPGDGRPTVAFFVHPNSPSYLDNFDRSFAQLDRGSHHRLASNLQGVIEPVPWHSFDVDRLRVLVFASPFLPSELARLGRKVWMSEVELMVLQARDYGARLAGLGGLLSVVTRNGEAVPDHGVGITTGNSLTAFAAHESLVELVGRHHPGARPPVAILGGYGNIGLAIAELLLRDGFEVILFGNPENPARRQMLSAAIRHLESRPGITGAVRAGERLSAHFDRPLVVLTATSDPSFELDLDPVPAGSTILDLAMPPSLSPEAAASHPKLDLYQVGRIMSPVEIPDPHLLECSNTLYGCLAETIILGLEHDFGGFSLGTLQIEKVLAIGERAKRLGFRSAFEPVRAAAAHQP